MSKVSREEFAQYVEANSSRFYRLAYSYVKNEDEATDIVQEAVLQGLMKLGTLRHPEYLGTWFYRVLVNKCVSQLRKNKNRPAELPLNEETVGADACDTDAAEVRALMDKLPPELKTVVFLRYYEEMKLSEISQVTGEKLSTVKSRLYRALKLLKIEILEGDEL